MFDLGLTLVDANMQAFPHVPQALSAVSGFLTADGKPLRTCLVSDFDMPTPPATAAKVSAIFRRYLETLDTTGLRSFFEPVQKRVTLSAHAGAPKPSRKIFEKALKRLGTTAGLADCLFITENGDHIRAARQQLHMQALQFRATGSSTFDFEDWSAAPALIAQQVAPHQAANLHGAVQAHLAAQGVDVLSVESEPGGATATVVGQVWHPVSLRGVTQVLVAVPVTGRVTRGPKGEMTVEHLSRPSLEEVAEVKSYVESLAEHGQIEGMGSGPASAPTHEIQIDEKGARRLVRKRFSVC